MALALGAAACSDGEASGGSVQPSASTAGAAVEQQATREGAEAFAKQYVNALTSKNADEFCSYLAPEVHQAFEDGQPCAQEVQDMISDWGAAGLESLKDATYSAEMTSDSEAEISVEPASGSRSTEGDVADIYESTVTFDGARWLISHF